MRSNGERARYMREYRATPEGRVSEEKQKIRDKARRLAYYELAASHPAEFKALLQANIRRLTASQ